MDVRKCLSSFFGLFLLSSCGKKTTATVFSDSGNIAASACSGQALENKFIVQWEDGIFTVESARTAAEFKENFIQPNLEKIRTVEYDRVLQFNQPVKTLSLGAADDWGQKLSHADSVWNQGFFGQGIKVAIVDSFVDINHPQIG